LSFLQRRLNSRQIAAIGKYCVVGLATVWVEDDVSDVVSDFDENINMLVKANRSSRNYFGAATPATEFVAYHSPAVSAYTPRP
jgi:hypothetical protein